MTGSRVDCDVAVIGAGAAGLSAAISAAGTGARVVVVDSHLRPGGQYYRQPCRPGLRPSTVQREGRALAAAAGEAGVEILSGTSVWSAGPDHRLGIARPAGRGTLRAGALVVACGAHERVAAFPGWTLPGVYTAGAVQTLVKEHGLVPGERVLFAGSGPLPLIVAAAVGERARVVGLLEASHLLNRVLRHPGLAAGGLAGQRHRLRETAGALITLGRRGVRPKTGWGIIRAHGDGHVEGATVARLDPDWRPVPGTERRIACDTVVVHAGLTPAVELCRLLGAALEWRPELGGHVPIRDATMATSLPGVYAAGDGAGVGGAEALLPIAEPTLSRADVVALARRVTLVHDPALDREFPERTPAVVRVSTRSGPRVLSVDTAQGDPCLAFPKGVLQAKHRRLLATVSPGMARTLLRLIHDEPRPSVRPLTRALRAADHDPAGYREPTTNRASHDST